MAAAHFLGQIFVLREWKEAARRVQLVALYHQRAVMQGRFGVEHRLHHLRGNLRVNYRTAFDYALGQVVVGENYQRAYVVFGHILNRADYLVHYKLDAGYRHGLRLTLLFNARIEQRAFDFGVEHCENNQRYHCDYEQ